MHAQTFKKYTHLTLCKMLNKNKSSHRRCSIKQGVCNNFAIFTGKRPCWSKVVGLIKAGLQHMCFPVNIAKFLREPILKNICERLFL